MRADIHHAAVTNGPRSSTFTITDFPFSRLVTIAVVPSGSDLLAATLECGFIR